MPSHTAASALIKLYFLDGAPWSWPAWQDITGIRHGLFPEDDNLLPKGWTRVNSDDVKSFFNAYARQDTEEKKISFSVNVKGGSAYPGREFWNGWILRKWSSWGIHTIVVEELREQSIHPMDILVRENNPCGPWPGSDSFLPMVLDPVGMRIFGDEAFPPDAAILPNELRKCLHIICQRSWNNIRQQVHSMKNRPDHAEEAARAAFKNLETGKPTDKKVAAAIQAVAKWKECAELYKTRDNVRMAEEMMEELKSIMETLGAEVEVNRGKIPAQKRFCKVKKEDLEDMATKQQVSEIIEIYHEYFNTDDDEEEEHPIPDAAPAAQSLNDCGGDFGMEEEFDKSDVNLVLSLGFMGGRPQAFNLTRHRSGLTPWENPKAFEVSDIEKLPDFLSVVKFHWHQLAGIHSIVRSIFTPKPNNGPLGVLIGDEVGLGKTAQAVGVIAFLNQVIWRREHGRKQPRMIVHKPYLGEEKTIRPRPHLIVCPGTLVAQWVNELKILILPHAVDIYVYDRNSDSSHFWGPEGPLAKSNQQENDKIIVASHPTILRDAKSHFNPDKKKRGGRPWDLPTPKRSLEGSIFGHEFLTITVDEAHHMRNAGRKHTVTLQLLQQGKVRLIMTATPLQTSSKDIAAMGRLVGIPHFSTEESFSEEKEDYAALRRAKTLEDDGEAAAAVSINSVKRLQGRLVGHFLRRTTTSLDFRGNVLLPLPKYEEVQGLLILTDRELDIIQARSDAAKAMVESSSNSSKIQTKKFYLEYRTAVGYAKENPEDLWPSFKTLEEWEPKKSTKMDVCAKMCAHYLSDDSVKHVEFVDGVPIFPPLDPKRKGKVSQERHILIYAEFCSMAGLLQNVLSLYGVESVAISGKTKFEDRDKQIKRFHDRKHPARVLIFSKVGSVGLNLSIADVVIFFDQPWSAQEAQQIIGRAWRQPQLKNVMVFYLLAKGSADLLMNNVARRKGGLFDVFVNKMIEEGDISPELVLILRGGVPDLPDEEDDKPRGKAKTKRRPKKSPLNGDLPRESEAEGSTTASGADMSIPPSDVEGQSESGHGKHFTGRSKSRSVTVPFHSQPSLHPSNDNKEISFPPPPHTAIKKAVPTPKTSSNSAKAPHANAHLRSSDEEEPINPPARPAGRTKATHAMSKSSKINERKSYPQTPATGVRMHLASSGDDEPELPPPRPKGRKKPAQVQLKSSEFVRDSDDDEPIPLPPAHPKGPKKTAPIQKYSEAVNDSCSSSDESENGSHEGRDKGEEEEHKMDVDGDLDTEGEWLQEDEWRGIGGNDSSAPTTDVDALEDTDEGNVEGYLSAISDTFMADDSDEEEEEAEAVQGALGDADGNEPIEEYSGTLSASPVDHSTQGVKSPVVISRFLNNPVEYKFSRRVSAQAPDHHHYQRTIDSGGSAAEDVDQQLRKPQVTAPPSIDLRNFSRGSPPTKRRRKGTVGDDERARISSAPNLPPNEVSADPLGKAVENVARRPSQKLQPSSHLAGLPRRIFTTQSAPTRSSSSNPFSRESASSGPSFRAGRLDDLEVPPKSSLMGSRSKPRPKKL